MYKISRMATISGAQATTNFIKSVHCGLCAHLCRIVLGFAFCSWYYFYAVVLTIKRSALQGRCSHASTRGPVVGRTHLEGGAAALAHARRTWPDAACRSTRSPQHHPNS